MVIECRLVDSIATARNNNRLQQNYIIRLLPIASNSILNVARVVTGSTVNDLAADKC